MASELEQLETWARELAEVARDRPQVARAARLADRLADGRFLICIAGEFKRGKSTLLNALLGEDVVPTGVLPLTAVATEVAYGEPSATVEHLDGSRVPIDRTELAHYVSEQANPANRRQVARVDVRGRWALLEPGVVLVDTPGVASLHAHNTEAATAVLLDADGAVLVLAADAPVSAAERELLGVLAARRAPSFFVLNKADHLGPAELDQVRRFVAEVLGAELGHQPPLFVFSARAALGAATTGRSPAAEAGDFGAFVAELERFVAEDLVAARLVTARRELAHLGSGLRDSLLVEQGALELGASTLAAQVEQFRADAARQRQAFEDDRTLLRRDVAHLANEVAGRLAAFATAAAGRHEQRLIEIAAHLSVAELAEGMRAAVEAAVREGFEAFRQAEAGRTEAAWRALAEAFRARTQERVNAVRQAAAALFAVPLPAATVPAVAEEGDGFFYLFVHVGSSSEAVSGLLGRLVPGEVARRRALARARAELVREFDKHAGRARSDLTGRLDAVRLRFEAAMAAELEEAVRAILAASARAEELAAMADAERSRHRAEARRQVALAETLCALGDERQ